MMTRISAVIIGALALSACTTLAGCGKQDAKVAGSSADQVAGDRVSIGESRMLAMEPFAGKGRWYAVINYGQGTEPVLVSEASAAAPDQRLVRLKPEKGYIVSRIHVSCPHGGYVLRDAREAEADMALPTKPSEGSAGLPIRAEIAKLCDKTAKVPTFEARLEDAVAKLRRMENGINVHPTQGKDLQPREPLPEKKVIDLRKK